MNSVVANSLYGYFEVLYRLNKRIIKLCGVVEPELGGIEKDVLDVIHDLGRVFPYSYNKKTNKLGLSMRDGLLEFSNIIPYLMNEYEALLNLHYEKINTIRKIRNKYEHKMHGVKNNSVVVGAGYADISFDMLQECNDEECRINTTDFIEIIIGLNELFSKLSKEVVEWAEDTNKTEYMYYRKITRFDFMEFNDLYKSPVIKKIGKILYEF